uniref:CCHC-type domain-containing protein n=1 Tax=Trichogramma kaykai TaxID=54128 RepID=A0ABD2WQ42_9HYME
MSSAEGAKLEFVLGKDDWEIFIDRLEILFKAKDTKDEKKAAILLTRLDEDAFKLIRNLGAPKKPTDQSYEELRDLMDKHLTPNPSEVMERWTFHQVEKLTFKAALKEAQARENAVKNALKSSGSYGTKPHAEVYKFQSADKNFQRKANRDKNTQVKCYRCNRSNHKASECRFKNAKCNSCGKQGYIKAVCRSKPEVKYIEEQSQAEREISGQDSSENESMTTSSAAGSSKRVYYHEDFFTIVAGIDTSPGLYNKSTVKFHLRNNAKPIALKSKHVPYTLKPRVEEEIQRLITLGHLERVETSEWATPIVPIVKKLSCLNPGNVQTYNKNNGTLHHRLRSTENVKNTSDNSNRKIQLGKILYGDHSKERKAEYYERHNSRLKKLYQDTDSIHELSLASELNNTTIKSSPTLTCPHPAFRISGPIKKIFKDKGKMKSQMFGQLKTKIRKISESTECKEKKSVHGKYRLQKQKHDFSPLSLSELRLSSSVSIIKEEYIFITQDVVDYERHYLY